MHHYLWVPYDSNWIPKEAPWISSMPPCDEICLWACDMICLWAIRGSFKGVLRALQGP